MFEDVKNIDVESSSTVLSKKFFEEAQTTRTLRNIKKTLEQSMLKKYNISDPDKVNDMLKIHGLHRDNFDFVKLIEKFLSERLNEISIDDNSNKNERTISGVIKEVTQSLDKAIGYDYLYRVCKELYGKAEAKRLMGELYDFSLGLNDSSKILLPYCWALDASNIVIEGRDFGVLPSGPAKRVSSYISALCETIHQMSNHLAGAIAIGTLFIDIAHLLIYKEKVSFSTLTSDSSFRKSLENEFQQFVHSVNHLSRNSVESPFTNISIFDRPKLKSFIGDDNMGWYFPKEGVSDETHLSMEHSSYIVEYIIELQKIFLQFFDKGDPKNDGRQYRFPVVTINISKHKNKEGAWDVSDSKALKDASKLEIFRYNIFSSEGTKIASCCRLISNAELMDYANQSNSFGGSAISLGSHRVVTVNYNRIANECSSIEDYYIKLENRIVDAAKILKAHKELLVQFEKKGFHPFITNKWISLKKMFSTIGVMGIVEAQQTLENRFKIKEDMIEKSLIRTNEITNEIATEFNLAFNIEQIPGESFASRLAKADKIICGDNNIPHIIYSNQFIPLWEDSTLYERMELDGKYNALYSGGGIVHFTLGEKTTSKQNESLIREAIRVGNEHFALNAIYSECESHHNIFGKVESCPKCGKQIIEYYTRVVGFFTPVGSWNKERKEWEFPKRVIGSVE